MNKKEEKLQSDIVVQFSQLYPKKIGQLFHVSNERAHKNQAYKARAIGIVPGVADMLYFSKNKHVATELKVKGERHLVSRIRKQLEWGELWEKKGNIWRMCFTVEEAISCYVGKPKGLKTSEVRKLVESVKTKTIKI